MPMTAQAPAKMIIGSSMVGWFSPTLRVDRRRGSPWKITPTTLVRQARANPPITARLRMADRLAMNTVVRSSGTPRKPPMKTKNSLTKPLNGGRPEMARDPMRKVTAVTFIGLIKPPKASMVRVPV